MPTRRGACLLIVGATAWLGACLRVETEADGPGEGDSGVGGIGVDAGASRPPTGEGWPLPDCGGAISDHGPGALDAGAGPVGGGPAAGPGGGTGGQRPVEFGQVVISELMVDPAAVSDTQGEWIELHNPTGTAWELQGCLIDDGGSTARAIADSFALAPGGYKAIARAASAGFPPAATMPMSLGNTGDAVAVSCDGVEIDRVVYGPGFPLAPGKSMALDSAALDGISNDAPGSWCLGTQSYGFDLGTPGKPNPDCFVVDEDAGI